MEGLVFWIIAFLIAITIHEAAHAFTADRLGDPTPRIMGRLSLNPFVHYDPLGTTLLLFLVFLRVMGFPVIPFGWAKPVIFDPYNLENPRRDQALISLAGPLANISLATILGIIIRITHNPFSFVSTLFVTLFSPLIILNVALAIFNLLPLHPLDGGKILVGILPRKTSYKVDLFLKRNGLLILFFLLFPFGKQPLLFSIIEPTIRMIIKILLPSFNIV